MLACVLIFERLETGLWRLLAALGDEMKSVACGVSLNFGGYCGTNLIFVSVSWWGS